MNSRHSAMIGDRLFRRGPDGILRRYVSQVEVPTILEAYHDSACGNISLAYLQAIKYLELDIFDLPYLRTHTIM